MCEITCKKCKTNCFINGHCSSEWIEKIESKKIQIDHRAKDCIFREGGYVEGIYFIQHGNVKIVSKGVDKKEQIVRLATDGQVLGHRGDGDDKYPVSAVALSDTVVCFIDNNTLNNAFMNNPKLAINLMMFYSRELRKVEIRMKYLMQMNIREKVAEALLLIKEVFGMDQKTKILNVFLSQQEISDMTGMPKNNVCRELNKFEKDKLIIKNGNSSIKLIDVQGLSDFIRKYGTEQYSEQR
jgi:CRP-like cAMP-binding protein